MKEFANVRQQVQTIQQTHQREASKAEDQATAAAVMQQANKQATEVIEQSSLSVEEYRQIAMYLPHDQKLQQQYQKVLGR